MDTVISRYNRAVRTRRARTHQDRIDRAYRQAIRPASEDPYVVALNITLSR